MSDIRVVTNRLSLAGCVVALNIIAILLLLLLIHDLIKILPIVLLALHGTFLLNHKM
jgi:hypothetical protein